MTVNAWSIAHHRTYDKAKTPEEQWQWLIELTDTDKWTGDITGTIVITPRRLMEILIDVITNEPRAFDEVELRSLAVTLGMALDLEPAEGF